MERIHLHRKERYQQVSLSRLSLLQVARQSWSEIGLEASAWHMGSSTDRLNQQDAQIEWEDEGEWCVKKNTWFFADQRPIHCCFESFFFFF